ncbi:MAG TPA: sigma-70 family RNA polymerase sigma factor [Burkholderiales bacterium]
MAARQPPQTAKANTLGDVLYAGGGPPVSESDWVRLVRSVAEGDQLALHALYERTARLVFTLVVRIVDSRQAAEEVTLDVFHDVWRRAGGYDPANGTVLGWIMNQARSRALDRLRFENRQKRVDPHAGEPLQGHDERDAFMLLELKQQGDTVRAALAALTPDERQVIEAAYFADLTHAEVAARLAQPLGTVKTRIRSALHKLRRVLGEEAGSS